MYLFDTCIYSFILASPAQHPLLIQNLDATTLGERWISIITAQELIAWRYDPLRKVASQQPPAVLRAYKLFHEMLDILGALQIKPFDEQALEQFNNMRGAGQIGASDRRIAAIALANNFTLITNNERDFDTIKTARPELQVENWTKRSYFPRI